MGESQAEPAFGLTTRDHMRDAPGISQNLDRRGQIGNPNRAGDEREGFAVQPLVFTPSLHQQEGCNHENGADQ